MANLRESIEEVQLSNVEEGLRSSIIKPNENPNAANAAGCLSSPETVTMIQKFIAEFVGTYVVIFAGCGSVAVNKIYGSVTFPGICVTWGLVVAAMIYTVGHISGAHFNPAVTITFILFRRFPYKQAPLYIVAQVLGSILASGTLALIFDVTPEDFFGTVPAGSNQQSLVLEIIISFTLMFVICGSGTDNRATGELSGLVVGMTIMLNVLVAGPVSGASMNPARSIGPALVKHVYKGLWIYILGPIIGTICGAFVYCLMRETNKTLSEVTKAGSITLSEVTKAGSIFKSARGE